MATSKKKTIHPILSPVEKIKKIHDSGKSGRGFISHLIKSFCWNPEKNNFLLNTDKRFMEARCCISNTKATNSKVVLITSPSTDKFISQETYEGLVEFHKTQYHGRTVDTGLNRNDKKQEGVIKKPFNKNSVKKSNYKPAKYSLGDNEALKSLKQNSDK